MNANAMTSASSNPRISSNGHSDLHFMPEPSKNNPDTPYTIPANISVDWACKVSPVINQGACGSCYVIAAL
jgi:hypothetical protein